MKCFARLFAILLICFSFAIPILSHADSSLPSQVAKSDIRFMESDSEIVGGAFPGLLLIPRAASNYRDEKYSQPYRVACHVYIAIPDDGKLGETNYERRFVVCCPDRDGLPFVRKVARLLLLLCNERRSRFGTDHPASLKTVNVWVTGARSPGVSADVGGEQFQNQIYLHNVSTERNPIEWMREICHEYGHYALPGISGFTSPEEWGNGLLGEKLFIKWIQEELQSRTLKEADVPFASTTALSNFIENQVAPLERRVMREGVDTALIARRDSAGMDCYVGLALYIDTFYGSRMLLYSMSETRNPIPGKFPRSTDFLQGFFTALTHDEEYVLKLASNTDGSVESSTMLYLPAGEWSFTPAGSLSQWRCLANPASLRMHGAKGLTVRKAGWYRLLTKSRGNATLPGRLKLRRS